MMALLTPLDKAFSEKICHLSRTLRFQSYKSSLIALPHLYLSVSRALLTNCRRSVEPTPAPFTLQNVQHV